MRDFIFLHCVLNQREDNRFWRANRKAQMPDLLARTLAHDEETGIVDWERS